MWYILPNYKGKLPKIGDFNVACVMVLEDLYSHIILITAKEGKFSLGQQKITSVILDTMPCMI